MSSSEWSDRFRDVGFEVKRLSQNVNYVALETLQTMLDYIEETFETIMIPPSKGLTTHLREINTLAIRRSYQRAFNPDFYLLQRPL